MKHKIDGYLTLERQSSTLSGGEVLATENPIEVINNENSVTGKYL